MDTFILNLSGLLEEATNKIADFSKYNELDPTFVSRYIIQATIINHYQKYIKKENIKVLDVGGAGSILSEFANIELTILDIIENDNATANYVVGNALNMPFKDKQFDIVINCDVLEHIKKEDREHFVKECSRVSKDLLIIAAPFNLTGVRLAEIDVNNFYKSLTGKGHIWLEEHLQDELPDLYHTKGIFKQQNIFYEHFSHTSLNYWQLLTRLGFLVAYKQKYPKIIQTIKEINEYYLADIMCKDFSEFAYRTFIIASKKNRIKINKEADFYNKEQEKISSELIDIIKELL